MVQSFLKKLKIELTYDHEIPLLGMHPEKTIIWKDTHTLMFTAALCIIATTRKQPQRLSQMIEDVTHTHTHTHTHTQCNTTQLGKEWNNATCSNMDGPRDDHTKWRKSDKDRYHLMQLICRIWERRYQWTYSWNMNRPIDIGKKLKWLPKGKVDGEG